jgi:probable rRNA maturation factor
VEISVYNRQRKIRIPMKWLRTLAQVALPECLGRPSRGDAPLPHLAVIEVTFVSDATIARVHRDFMDIPGATDVITFDHGEIVISTETARENAARYGRPFEEELARYVVHGLLHLNGYEDQEPADFSRMQRVQEEVLEVCLEKLP